MFTQPASLARASKAKALFQTGILLENSCCWHPLRACSEKKQNQKKETRRTSEGLKKHLRSFSPVAPVLRVWDAEAQGSLLFLHQTICIARYRSAKERATSVTLPMPPVIQIENLLFSSEKKGLEKRKAGSIRWSWKSRAEGLRDYRRKN